MVMLGQRLVAQDQPPYLCAEIGINHDGSLERALWLIDQASLAGAHAVKFQKRTPELAVPRSEWDKPKETPWGEIMPYIEYKRRMEFGRAEYDAIAQRCKDDGIDWFASPWDEPSVEFLEQYEPIAYKIGSPSLTDKPLIERIIKTGRPIILSTGMSTIYEIGQAVWWLHDQQRRLILLHCTSIYPCPPDKMNLSMLRTLREAFPHVVIGYSGHERGTDHVAAEVALGACFLERHFTKDRFAKGSDHAASLEPWQFCDLAVKANRTWLALGNGEKQVYAEEQANAAKLRRSLFQEVH